MDIDALVNWLKNTVPGIVLLGAIGSILAAIVLWLAKKLLLPLLRKYFLVFFAKLIGHLTRPASAQLSRLYLSRSKDKVELFCTLQLMKLVFTLFVTSWSFMLFLYFLSSSTGTFYRFPVLAPLITVFLGL